MPRRSCNLNLLQDTASTYYGVANSLHPTTRRRITSALSNARAAANRGHCADMHKHAQAAREVLERRLDNLLGARRR